MSCCLPCREDDMFAHLGQKPESGLYTLQFSAMPAAADEDATKDLLPEDAASIQEAKAKVDRVVTATKFSEWGLLCRLSFDGELAGNVKGSIKVRPPGGGAGADGAGGSSSGSRASLMPDSRYEVFEGTYYLVNLSIQMDRLDAAVTGSSKDHTNVVLRCQGGMCLTYFVGSVTILQGSSCKPIETRHRLRFLLKLFNGPRCTRCLDPVETVGYTCACDAVDYCSRRCQDAHHQGHSNHCAQLKEYASPKGGRASATFAGVEFGVWWRKTGEKEMHTYDIFVDQTNPLGRAYEVHIDLMEDARYGLQYQFLPAPDAQQPQSSGSDGSCDATTQEVTDLTTAVFHAVYSAAVREGCMSLASTCLNHLYTWSSAPESLLTAYLNFYGTCVGNQYIDMVKTITHLAEYVAIVRPLYEGGQLFLECALKAQIAHHFWQRIDAAREFLICVYNFNAAVTFAPPLQYLRQPLVPDQRRQTLKLLAKVFIVMASRASKDAAQRMLRRAEECYKDSVDEDKNRNDLVNMGKTCLQLSVLYLMFADPQEHAKSKLVREQGLELLKMANTKKSMIARAKREHQQNTQQQQEQHVDPQEDDDASAASAPPPGITASS